MDEYDYLEAQLEAGAPAATQTLPGPPPLEENGKERHRSSSSRRSRSRSRERSRKSSRRSRSREKSSRKDRDRPDRDERPRASRERSRERREPPVPRPRERTPPEVRLQREKEQELKDLERTVRTVMVMNLNLRGEEKDIFMFFSTVGRINDIKLIRDKNTKRSKGIAYVEFATVEAAINALTLNGQLLLSMPVLVKPSEAEKNLAWEAQQQAKQNQAATITLLNKMGGTAPGVKLNPIKLQILNLHQDIGEEDLRELFKPFGEINYVRVVTDTAGGSTGEAYVQYADEPMANNAIKHFNGFEIAGKKLVVQIAPAFNPLAPNSLSGPPPPALDPQAAFFAAGGSLPGPPQGPPPGSFPNGMQGPGYSAIDLQAAQAPQNVNDVDDLDESNEKGAFKLNAQSRAALMSRLASRDGMQPPPSFLGTLGGVPAPAPQQPVATGPVLNVPQQVLLDQGLLGPASPIPTPCILLKNMFSDSDKAEPDWQTEVAEDVKSEASKFGEVMHIHVNPDSMGHVYLKFSSVPGAETATRTLHGRYYSGKQIVVSYQFVHSYNGFFGLK